MVKKVISPLLVFLIILSGCQSHSTNENEEHLLSDSKELYQAIKNEEDSAFDLIEAYRENYVKNYTKFKNQEDLITELDSLSGAYISYHGTDNEENKQVYKEKITSLLSSLDTEFNN